MILKLEPQTLANEFSQLGIHPASEAIFLHKSEIVPLKILDIRTPAANIIKQEMLGLWWRLCNSSRVCSLC